MCVHPPSVHLLCLCAFGCVMHLRVSFSKVCAAEHTDVSFRGGYQQRRAQKRKGAKCRSLRHIECEWRLVVP